MFMDPRRYVALDSNILKCMEAILHGSSQESYLQFIDICRTLQKQVYALDVPAPVHGAEFPNIPKEPDGKWLLADIQQAVFEFAREDKDNNRIVS